MHENQYRKRSEYFQQKIRREQISDIFAQQRQILLQHLDRPRVEEFNMELKDNIAEQREFLAKCALELTGEPSITWLPTINSLKNSVFAFKGQFQHWFTTSIILNLTLAIKSKPAVPKLIPQICILLSDMMWISHQNRTNFTSRLMEFQIIAPLVIQGTNSNYSLRDRVQMFRCCGNGSQTSDRFKNQLMNNSGGSWMVKLGNQMLNSNYDENKLISLYLLAVQAVIKFESVGKYDLPNLNSLNRMIPICSTFLLYSSDQEVVENAIDSLNQMLKYDRDSIYLSIFHFNGVVRKAIDCLTHRNALLRRRAIGFICRLTNFNDIEVAKTLQSLGILDAMYDSHILAAQNSSFNKALVTTLGNLADYSDRLAISIMEHPIFKVVRIQIENQESKNRIQAHYALNTMIKKSNYHNFIHILSDFDFLHALVFGLKDLRRFEMEATYDILSTILILVQRSQQYYSKTNQLMDSLSNNYNFINLLQDIINKTKNKLVQQTAQFIHERFSQQTFGSIASL